MPPQLITGGIIKDSMLFIVQNGVPHDYFSAETFNPTFIVRDSFSQK
jgi:hypothetical protein